MPETIKPQGLSVKEGGPAAQRCQTALAATYKALKAYTFYPEGHPLRDRILTGAYHALSQVAREELFSLNVHRNGFSLVEGRTPIESTPVTVALAQELFAREIQRFVVLPELSQPQFNRFLSLLALDPQKTQASGGLIPMLKQQGIDTIVLDEIDISAVFTRRRDEQAIEDALGQGTGPQAQEGTGSASSLPDETSHLSIEELIELMSREPDDQRYRQLARLLLAKGLPLKQEQAFDRLYNLAHAVAQQGFEPGRSPAQREQACALLQQLVPGELAEHLLDHLEDQEFRHSASVCLILKGAGAEVVDAVIDRLIAAGLKASRKPLIAALLSIGPAAEPALFALMKDGRWQVVLTAVTILAEMGSKDAVKGLLMTVNHSDTRVRMESIRALSLIGGMEASAALLELLRDPNQAVAAHAITWLGNTRNQRALQPLLQLVLKRDLRGRIRPLKKEALAAIGRLGDRRALEALLKLVQRRYWIAPSRWEELKPIAVEAIGNLGGPVARQFLGKVAAEGGQLGRVASRALESMEKRNPETS